MRILHAHYTYLDLCISGWLVFSAFFHLFTGEPFLAFWIFMVVGCFYAIEVKQQIIKEQEQMMAEMLLFMDRMQEKIKEIE